MGKDGFNQWMKDKKEWENMIGTKIEKKVNILKISLYTLNRNHSDILAFNSIFQKDASIWGINNRNKLYDVNIEFIRILHNYLSALFSLKEHTHVFREFIKDIVKDDTIENDFISKVTNPDMSKIFDFLINLRNYTQHKEMPLVGASFEWKRDPNHQMNFDILNIDETVPGSTTKTFSLEKEELLEWDKWTQNSLSFINQSNSYIDIIETISINNNNMKILYEWYFQRIHEYFSEYIEKSINVGKELEYRYCYKN